jgi:hypothetical protein
MEVEKRDRKAEYDAKNREKRAAAKREARKLARITKMSPAEVKESSLAEVFKAEEDRKALAARAQQVGDDMQAQRWADRIAEDAAKQAADLTLRQTDPRGWAVEQLRDIIASSPYEQERARRLGEKAYNMGVPLDQIEECGHDSFRIEQLIRAMAYCPDSEANPFEEGVKWAAGQLAQLAASGYQPNETTVDELLLQLRSEKGLL